MSAWYHGALLVWYRGAKLVQHRAVSGHPWASYKTGRDKMKTGWKAPFSIRHVLAALPGASDSELRGASTVSYVPETSRAVCVVLASSAVWGWAWLTCIALQSVQQCTGCARANKRYRSLGMPSGASFCVPVSSSVSSVVGSRPGWMKTSSIRERQQTVVLCVMLCRPCMHPCTKDTWAES